MSILMAIMEYGRLGLRFNPPAYPRDLIALAEALDCVLPPEMEALYRHGNGCLPFSREDFAAGDLGEVFRLMSTEEAARDHPVLAACFINVEGRRAFWSDDQSNHALLYVEGPLAGRVAVMMHDDPDFSPTHRSVESFLLAVARQGRQGHEGEAPFPDYPTLAPAPETDPGDREAARAMAARFAAEDGEDRAEQFAYCAIVLTPYDETDTLLDYARHQDMYVQEKACNVLGLRKWAPALPVLAEIAESGTVNGRQAAMRALGRLGTPEALAELLRLHGALDARDVSSRSWLFAQAFEDAGCEVDWTDRPNPRFRPPGGEWRPVRRE